MAAASAASYSAGWSEEPLHPYNSYGMGAHMYGWFTDEYYEGQQQQFRWQQQIAAPAAMDENM
eukprot:3924097-Amphidinium_carterae.1